jgi:hypothetical protein
MEHDQHINFAMASTIKIITLGFMLIIYVFIPSALVCFYSSRHVKATCERVDTKIRWTDRCPLPVLAISLMSGFSAIYMLSMGAYNWTMPVFGFVLSGIPGALVVLCSILLLAYIARGTYRLDLKAWWCALLLVSAWGVSLILFYSQNGMMEIYEKMGFSAQQMDAMKPSISLIEGWMVPLSVTWIIAILGYLLYVRKFFLRAPEQTIETEGVNK